MTYTVKNGTWCKDNEKEYYSTTKTGLKAALKAGEISAGTRVVIHDPKYHAGQLIQSMNPNCPEGCFVPDGSAFDISIYTDLAEVFPDGNLPDLRECSLVMVGRSGRPEITNHDEYTAGQFKNDQFAEHKHTATSTVTDPGHNHGITDPGHNHGRGTQNITGTFGSDDVNAPEGDPITGAFYTQSNIPYDADSTGSGDGRVIALDASRTWTGRSTKETTGVSVNSATTGISVDTVTANAGAADNVTHGKQVGVYYYIAF